MGFGKLALTPTPTHTQVRARGDNVGLGRVPRDLILVEILPRALVAPRHYWRHLTDAAAAPAAAAWRGALHARARAWEVARGIVLPPPPPETDAFAAPPLGPRRTVYCLPCSLPE